MCSGGAGGSDGGARGDDIGIGGGQDRAGVDGDGCYDAGKNGGNINSLWS